MNLERAEAILAADHRLQPRPLHNERYELTYAGHNGRQISINRKAHKTAVRIWIEGSVDPHAIGLSTARIEAYPAIKPRAHLSASRLTGPYRGRRGNDAWYVALTSETDFGWVLEDCFGLA